ncbi:hypothetical protein [Propionivibrio sp.]|uniref:hypothetical protein n=1 Tax=Propionivibrio sp. TaxID=2212460 RepID=UPI0025CF8F21|nr:hypothetical protein [Propionivibrio sp.]
MRLNAVEAGTPATLGSIGELPDQALDLSTVSACGLVAGRQVRLTSEAEYATGDWVKRGTT